MAKWLPAAQTAFGPMVIAASEQHYPAAQRIVLDDLAVNFLPPGLRFMVRASRPRSVRNLVIAAMFAGRPTSNARAPAGAANR
jgi:hypothetical protein